MRRAQAVIFDAQQTLRKICPAASEFLSHCKLISLVSDFTGACEWVEQVGDRVADNSWLVEQNVRGYLICAVDAVSD